MSRFPVTHGQLISLLAQARAEGRDADVIRRLEWFAHFAQHRSISKTCQHFGIARTTFYRWLKRFDPQNLDSLTDQAQPGDDASRERFVEPHTFAQEQTPRISEPEPEPVVPLRSGRRLLGLGMAFALSVALLIGALLGQLPQIRLTANVSEQNAISVPIDLETSPGTDDVQVRIESQGVPLSGSVRDCTPSVEDGKPGWTCSLRIEP